jgi:HlyD family secretion protein
LSVLAVKEGDKVKKGQLLMKLWNDDQQAQSSLAQAQVETARKRVAEACTVAANAEREADRQAALAQAGFCLGSREEQARADAQARRAGCDAAKADVAQTQSRVNATQVEQSAPCCTHRLPARWPRLWERWASTPHPPRPVCQRRQRLT